MGVWESGAYKKGRGRGKARKERKNKNKKEKKSSLNSHPLFHIYTSFDTEGYFGEWVWSVINLNEIQLLVVK